MLCRTGVCAPCPASLQNHQRGHPPNHHPNLVRTVADSSLRRTCQSLESVNGHEPSQLSGHRRMRAACLAEHLRVQVHQSLLHVVLQPVFFGPSQRGDLNLTSLLSWMGAHGLWDWDKAILVYVQSPVGHLRLLSHTSLAFTSHSFTWLGEVLAL
jgi:hypothetical protein